MEKCFEFQQKIFLCFIDYSKALDCVRYSALWAALQEMGILSHLIHLIRNLYDIKLHVFELRKEIVTDLVWDREFDRGAFYHHHSSTCMQNT